MNHLPKEKIGVVAVSRDCFPMTLSVSRRNAVVQAYQEKYGEIYECPVCVENELHMREALADLKGAGCNALAVYLGKFSGSAYRVFRDIGLPMAQLQVIACIEHAAVGVAPALDQVLPGFLRCRNDHRRPVKFLDQQRFWRFRAKIPRHCR